MCYAFEAEIQVFHAPSATFNFLANHNETKLKNTAINPT
jgi:hypothetical protein